MACQRDLMFTFDGRSYGPLVRAEKAFVIFVRRQSDDVGFHNQASPGFEHQKSYIEFWLRFIGVRDVATMTVEHTWDDQAADTFAPGKAHAVAAAGSC